MLYDYVVVGAGISGLYSAYLLKKQGLSFCLLEASPELGGTWKSIKYKNSLFELGPNTIIDSSTDLQKLISELGIDNEVLKTPLNKSKRYIFKGKDLIELSSNPFTLINSGLISLKAFLRIFLEPLKNKNGIEEESVRAFAERKFGIEPSRILLETFLKGVWAGDPEKLSSKYALKFLVELENNHGSIFKAMLAKAFSDSKETKKKKSIVSFKEGLQFLTSRMADFIGCENIKLNSRLTSVESHEEKYDLLLENGEAVSSKKIIFGTRAFEVSEALNDLAPDLSKLLNEIYYAPIALFAYTLPKEKFLKEPDGFGYLSANASIETLGTIWASELFPERNLEDEYLCLSFIGGAKNTNILKQNEYEIFNKVIDEQILVYRKWTLDKLVREDFNLIACKKIEKAIPQLNLGHSKKIEELQKLLKTKYRDFQLVGNYIDGVAIKDALASSSNAVL